MDTRETASADQPMTASLDAPGWVTCLGHVARHYGISFSAQSALNSAAWNAGKPQADQLALLGRHLGLRVRLFAPEKLELTAWRLPVVCELNDGTIGIVSSLSKSGEAGLLLAGEQDATIVAVADLVPRIRQLVIARPLRTLVDERVDNYIAPYREGCCAASPCRICGPMAMS